MTKLEYADYQARVARFFGETGCSNLSCAATGDCEPYFSAKHWHEDGGYAFQHRWI